MTEFNDTLKKILAEKFAEGIKREGLTKSEATRQLGLSNENYGTMITNSPQRAKVPTKAWRRVQEWANSGELIRTYSKKHDLYVEHKRPKPAGRKPKGILLQEGEEPSTMEANNEPMDLTDKTLQSKIIHEDLEKGKFRVEMQIVDKPKEARIQDVPLDRLKVIFDAINELKALGYQVDINIYERGGRG